MTVPSKNATLCGDHGNKNRHGQPCQNHVMIGTMACKWHSGKRLEKHRADGKLRQAIDEWGISRNEYIDPGDTFLRLIAQSSRRVQRYADAIAALVERQQAFNGHAAEAEEVEIFPAQMMAAGGHDAELAVLLAPEYAVTKDGERVYIGKQLAALTKLESEERDRLASWCKTAITAGLEERRVKLAEQQGMHLAQVVRGFAERLGLSVEQKALMPAALRGAVTEVFGRQPATVDGEVVT